MPIKYACINDGKNLVSEYPVNEHPYEAATMQEVLSTVPEREYRRQTVEDTHINYHYLSTGGEHGRVLGVVASSDVKARVIFAFLDSVEQSVRGFTPYELQNNSKKLLSSKMEHYNNPANDKISAVQMEIEKTKDIMVDNVDKALARTDQLDGLDAKAVSLENQASVFNKKSKELKKQMCMRNLKLAFMIGGACAVLLFIIIIIICKPNFSSCR